MRGRGLAPERGSERVLDLELGSELVRDLATVQVQVLAWAPGRDSEPG